MKRSHSRAPALATLLLPALAFASAASADTAELRYKDLDLTTEAGKTELARRIDQTARKACTPETITGSRIPNRSAQDHCIADAKRQIDAQIASRASRNSYGR